VVLCPSLEDEADPARDRHAVSDGITPDGQPTLVVDIDARVLIGPSAFARPAPTRPRRGREGDWLSRRVGEDLADHGRDCAAVLEGLRFDGSLGNGVDLDGECVHAGAFVGASAFGQAELPVALPGAGVLASALHFAAS
jgi:hypothetical protein